MERFISSPKIEINPPLFYQDELRRRVMLALNMSRIGQHVFQEIRFANTLTSEPVFDSNRPIRSTGDMMPWFTGRPCEPAKRSHINFVVVDFDLGKQRRQGTGRERGSGRVGQE